MMSNQDVMKIPSIFDETKSEWKKNHKLAVAWHLKDHSDFVSLDCVLCGKEMKSVYETHNPYPLSVEGRCCDECQETLVLSARMDIARGKRAA
jgi:hypothetical protein